LALTPIIVRNGVTKLCSQVVDPEKLLTEFQEVAARLEEVLKDLEWRKPDVEAEEAKLAELENAAREDPGVDVASQRVVVRVAREVLNDKLVEADRLEKRMLELKAQIEALETQPPATEEEAPSGEAVREEEKRVG